MKIRYLANSCFVITADNGTKIITDPYTSGYRGCGYAEIRESADVVTVSHEDPAHANIKAIGGSPHIIRNLGDSRVGKITFKGISAYHDKIKGKERGEVVLFRFEVDGLGVCHLGDLGDVLSKDQICELGHIDVLFVPVGGASAIGPADAKAVCEGVRPGIAIPMHYRTDAGGFVFVDVTEFADMMPHVKRLECSELEVTENTLPKSTQVVILRRSL